MPSIRAIRHPERTAGICLDAPVCDFKSWPGGGIGIHNCPGYSASGGPWITPELSMQEVCTSQTLVDGGARFAGELPRPQVDPRAVMAFPVVNKDAGLGPAMTTGVAAKRLQGGEGV